MNKAFLKALAPFFLLIAAFVTFFVVTGCATLWGNRAEIRDAVVDYLARYGQQRAEDYVDSLVTDGKLSASDAANVKAAIPKGIDEVKEALK